MCEGCENCTLRDEVEILRRNCQVLATSNEDLTRQVRALHQKLMAFETAAVRFSI